jgi:hypothetical protein
VRVKAFVAATQFALLLTLSAQVNKRVEPSNQNSSKNDGRSVHVSTLRAKDGGLTTETITGMRNMSLYEDGGHFDCRGVTLVALKKPNEERTRIASAMKRARTFIWEHWQLKKRGYVRLTFNSVDATSTSHIFIEPDSDGVWQVTWRIVRHNDELDDVPTIRAVERKDVDGHTVLMFMAADGTQLETL